MVERIAALKLQEVGRPELGLRVESTTNSFRSARPHGQFEGGGGPGYQQWCDGDGFAQRVAVAVCFTVERVGVARTVGIQIGPHRHLLL